MFVAYNFGLRYLFKTQPLPRYPLARRFTCLMATAMLVAAAWGFQVGNAWVGYGFGWFMVAAAGVNVTTGFCIPSFIYGLLFGKPVLKCKQ